MALDAGVVGGDVFHTRWVENVAARGVGDVFAAGAVAAFATDVPLGDLFGLNIVVDGMAAIARGAGGALHVIGGIKGFPPVGALGYEIWLPDVVGDVPLSGFGEIVLADFCEVALLPDAAVNEGDVGFGELFADVVGGEIGNDGFGMLAGIADHVSHRSFFPVLVDLLVAFLASGGAGIVR
jgi:hypothetical protein